MMYKTICTLFLTSLVFINCSNPGTELKNKISITVKVVDSETKQPRMNDSLTIRQGTWGIPVRRYIKVGKYITDSLGQVRIDLNKQERYSFEVDGPRFAFGSDEYAKGELKNGQTVIIQVVLPEKKQVPFLKNE